MLRCAGFQPDVPQDILDGYIVRAMVLPWSTPAVIGSGLCVCVIHSDIVHLWCPVGMSMFLLFLVSYSFSCVCVFYNV